MRENLTGIVFMFDCNGSMSGLEADTIGGFNSMIEKQKKAEGEGLIVIRYYLALRGAENGVTVMVTPFRLKTKPADIS